MAQHQWSIRSSNTTPWTVLALLVIIFGSIHTHAIEQTNVPEGVAAATRQLHGVLPSNDLNSKAAAAAVAAQAKAAAEGLSPEAQTAAAFAAASAVLAEASKASVVSGNVVGAVARANTDIPLTTSGGLAPGAAQSVTVTGQSTVTSVVSISTQGVSPTCQAYAFGGQTSYQWMANDMIRQKAQVYRGSQARLRAAIDRYLKGGNLTVAIIGGSIAAGQGALDGRAFPAWMELILQKVLGNRVQVHNGAVPGTLSSYMSVCHNVHVPKHADIVLLDYTVNDQDQPIGPVMDNPVRRPFERLLRKLMYYPNKPAVIMVHSYIWHKLAPFAGVYWTSCERDFHDLATYYRLQEVSVKASAWKLMKAGVEGFQVHRTRGDHAGRLQPGVDATLKGKVFYWDIIHPDGMTGHRFMGEIAAQAVLDGVASVKASPLTPEELAEIDDIPPPMMPNNWESKADKCFIGPHFQVTVVSSVGWTWKDEGKDPKRPKLGYISELPGSVLKISVNTTSPTGNKALPVTIEVAYLRSYVNMGQASVVCESGCTCTESKIDGHHTDKTSQLFLHEWKASQSDHCIVAITVLPLSSSGKHKIKVAGIMISEEGGEEGVKNWAAVEMVHDTASSTAGKGQFSVSAYTAGHRRRSLLWDQAAAHEQGQGVRVGVGMQADGEAAPAQAPQQEVV